MSTVLRLALFALAFVACGGEDAPPDASAIEAGPDVIDSGPDIDGGACRPTCPSTLPNQGDPCGAYRECEYGDAAATEQNAWAQCACGYWSVWPAPPTYATSCPGYGDGGCTELARRCDYKEGACVCAQSGDAGLAWTCQAQLPSCPWPRPRVGGACSPTDQCNALFSKGAGFCSYTCCTKADCCGGTWDFGCVSTLPPPC